jgi:hypothetical protein
MLSLDRVTLLGIDCVDINRLIFAAEISCKKIQFKEVKLLSSIPSEHPWVISIPKIDSIEAYSHFMIKNLLPFVNTEFVLIIQYDGFVLNPSQWKNEFLNFDYIGAPTFWGMGNGGFSLRSRKLIETLHHETEIKEFHPEDIVICKSYRSFLESKDIQFATSEIADSFSVEGKIWDNQLGFHNADIRNWNIEAFADPEKHDFFIQKHLKQRENKDLKLTYVVHFYIDQSEKTPLHDLIAIYSRYDAQILNQIHFVLVDDGSPIPVEIDPQTPLNFTLARIQDNILWNQAGARNLGVHLAKTEKIIITDLDIIFPEPLLHELLDFYPPKNAIFKFKTISNLQVVEPHFNVFLLWKDTFMKTLGVDEEFSGRYGYEDVFFYFLNKALGVKFYLHKNHNIVHREHKENKRLQHNPLVRNMDENKKLFDHKMEQIKNTHNPLEARSKLYLNFSWEIVVEGKRR